MLGIIGAMKIETDSLIAEMNNVRKESAGAFVFSVGEIKGKTIVVCECGIGKVFSSSAAALMIEKFGVDTIINVGVAGGRKPLRQGDVVIAEKTVQHDYDATPDGLPLGQVHGFDSPYFDCDSGLVKALDGIMTSMNVRHKVGIVATGDCFVGSKEKAASISATFDADAYDMESAAINQICAVQNVKFVSLRAISDNGDDEAVKSFYEFVTAAAEIALNVLRRLIEEV